MKNLFIILLLSISSVAFSQNGPCDPPNSASCPDPGPCVEIPVESVTPYEYRGLRQIYVDLGWQSNYLCYKMLEVYVNDVRIQPWGTGTGGGHVEYTCAIGEQIKVVIRSICTIPLTCNPTNYTDSAPIYVTPYQTGYVDCRCTNGNYKVVKGSRSRCVSLNNCSNMITRGWTSSCNCQ